LQVVLQHQAMPSLPTQLAEKAGELTRLRQFIKIRVNLHTKPAGVILEGDLGQPVLCLNSVSPFDRFRVPYTLLTHIVRMQQSFFCKLGGSD